MQQVAIADCPPRWVCGGRPMHAAVPRTPAAHRPLAASAVAARAVPCWTCVRRGRTALAAAPRRSCRASIAFAVGGGLLVARRYQSSRRRGRYNSMALAAIFGKSDAQAIEEYFGDKVLWVTGASAGLGEALCLALARGSRPRGLIISARRELELQRVRRQCLELQPELKVKVLPLDLGNVDSLPAAAKEATSFCGLVDVLFNNGGRGFRDVAAQTPLEIDRMMMDINYFSGVCLVKSLLGGWIERGTGHVIQIASVQGFFGLPGRTAYAATKHAAMGFYDSLRSEVADSGIAVTMVAPGYINTAHSAGAAHGSGGKYPEGHTSKGVAPEVLAVQVLAAAARKKQEIAPAAVDARIARLLRCACPPVLFWAMVKRARKERREREGLAAAEAHGKSLKAA